MNTTYIFVKVDPCFAFEPCGFLECKTLNILQNWVGNVQYATNHQHKYFPSTIGHLEIPKVANKWNQMEVLVGIHPPQYWV
jgi:hypothetical protein